MDTRQEINEQLEWAHDDHAALYGIIDGLLDDRDELEQRLDSTTASLVAVGLHGVLLYMAVFEHVRDNADADVQELARRANDMRRAMEAHVEQLGGEMPDMPDWLRDEEE